ncbi:hypothetical protein CEUSTIGMA_g7849.t1 [Chlamydomonas eustigma]|uniref:Exportin-1/Importin-beta-like domain-containing protein n=1 Tax=Chlamydomonas eustigma TaxID=1157962 RepID=A0A250XCC3_9CHLO|nr:hypothetical protein CEUSTIGMA_g7849.t1 [Chlamydomonas eustigma]|eukprot:GAX80410.1 hypothetical protein CEUSTIGMA_g7849.t1 [Chlamydomonas eustigma]
MDVTLFHQALSAFFGSDPSQQQQANIWLQGFSATSGAWEAAASLVEPSVPTNISFFCANMLLSKARNDFSSMPIDQQPAISQMISIKLQAISSAAPQPGSLLVLERLSSALACTAALSGASASAHFVEQAVQMLVSALGSRDEMSVLASLRLLTGLAVEVERLDWTRKQPLLCSLQGLVPRVVSVLQDVLVAGGLSSPTLSSPALFCLSVCLKLGPSSSTDHQACMTPGEIQATAPRLLPALVSSLGGLSTTSAVGTTSSASNHTSVLAGVPTSTESGDHAGAEGEGMSAVAEILVSVLSVSSRSTAGDEAAVRELAQALLQHRTALQVASSLPASPDSEDDSQSTKQAHLALRVTREVAWVVSALTERDCCSEWLGIAVRSSSAAASSGTTAASPLHQEALALGASGGVCHLDLPVALGELMLLCLRSPSRSCADAALEYFQAINTVSVSERHPQLGTPLFASALPHLLKHGQYPQAFKSWADADIDEDEFYRFRDQHLLEVLESAYGMLRSEYLHVMYRMAMTATTWQQYEVGLYGLRAVSVVRVGLSPTRGHLEPTASTLLEMFTQICSGSGNASKFSGQPMVAKSACRLIGAYAQWFSTLECGATLLGGALKLLLDSLRLPDAAPPAAVAFRGVCSRCAGRMAAEPSGLMGLMAAAAHYYSPAPEPQSGTNLASPSPALSTTTGSGSSTLAGPCSLGEEERVALVEGLARVVAALPREQVGDAGLTLIAPLVVRSRYLAESGALTQESLRVLAIELRLMAAALRFLELPPIEKGAPVEQQHPAMKVLEGAWPILSGVAQSMLCQRSAVVVEALCDVYQRSILSAKLAARPLIATLIASCLTIYKVYPNAHVCDVLGTTVEVFGELKSIPETGKMQRQAFKIVASSTQSMVSVSAADQAELFRGVFSMADRYLVFARDTLLCELGAVQQLLVVCRQALTLRDRDGIAQALAFLTHLAALPAKLPRDSAEAAEHFSRLCTLLVGETPQLAASLIAALMGTCPQQLIRALAGALHTLLTCLPVASTAEAWLGQALSLQQQQQQQYLVTLSAAGGNGGERSMGVSGQDRLGSEGRVRFMKLAVSRSPPLPRGRFEAMVCDVAAIARGEETNDALLGYELT